jgi:hypothetical protein
MERVYGQRRRAPTCMDAKTDGTVLFKYRWKTKYDINAIMLMILDHDDVFVSSAYNVGATRFRLSGNRKTCSHFNKCVFRDEQGNVVWIDVRQKVGGIR